MRRPACGTIRKTLVSPMNRQASRSTCDESYNLRRYYWPIWRFIILIFFAWSRGDRAMELLAAGPFDHLKQPRYEEAGIEAVRLAPSDQTQRYFVDPFDSNRCRNRRDAAGELALPLTSAGVARLNRRYSVYRTDVLHKAQQVGHGETVRRLRRQGRLPVLAPLLQAGSMLPMDEPEEDFAQERPPTGPGFAPLPRCSASLRM